MQQQTGRRCAHIETPQEGNLLAPAFPTTHTSAVQNRGSSCALLQALHEALGNANFKAFTDQVMLCLWQQCKRGKALPRHQPSISSSQTLRPQDLLMQVLAGLGNG